MSQRHRLLARHRAHDGWCKIDLLDIALPDGSHMRRELEHHGDAVGVLPYDATRRVAMVVSQFRAPVFSVAGDEAVLLEAPAGLLEDEEPQASARREAEEETGLKLGYLEEVVTAWTMPGISTERMHLFLAAYDAASRLGSGGGLAHEQEDITLHEMPLADLAQMADEGRLRDLKLLLLIQTLRLRRPVLFQ